MKKQILTVAAIITAAITNAQTWSENFSSSTAPNIPATWSQNNVDGKTVYSGLSSWNFGTRAWVTKDISALNAADAAAHGKIVASTSYYTPAGIANDWLITPSFTVPVNGVLQWDAMASNANFPDGYQVKLSTTGTTTAAFSTNLLTVPGETAGSWNTRTINLNSYAGQVVNIAFINNSNDMELLLMDNFSVLVPASNDMKTTAVGPTGQSIWGQVGTNKSITGTIKNNGLTNITSFTAKYFDGTTTQSSTFNSLNLAYGQTYNFTISTPFTITQPVQTNIKVWADVTGDVDHTNDTMITTVNGYSFLPNHKVVFEEATGTWCGWCVRGAVYMDSMYNVNPNTTELIAVHNADPMVVSAYDSGIGTMISGYPNALCGRKTQIGDPSTMFTMYNNHKNDFGIADLTVNGSFNAGTRLATISVDVNPASSFTNNTTSNDYRLAVVFTENGVTGTTTQYDQHNYYSGGSYGQMVGAGHHFDTEANPVVAANMVYDFVARDIVGGFNGLANSLPSGIVSGAVSSKTFTYTVPAAYNANKMRAIALLIDAKNKLIYNSNGVNLSSIVTNIQQQSAETVEFALFPNPTAFSTTIEFNLTSEENVTVNIYNSLGSLVYSDVKNNLQTGQNYISLNTETFANGIYNVVIATKKGVSTKKLTVSK